MLIRLSHKITRDSIVDGPGLRAVIWAQGCKHNCFGCHNPSTHDFGGGFLMDTEDLIKELKDLKLHRGITFSGGDPFEQPYQCLEIARQVKKMGMDIWCYTGYTFEELINKQGKKYKDGWIEFLKYIDVLIDGPFILEKKNLLLKFRGSENQRVIDVKKSLRFRTVVLLEEYHNIKTEKIALAR
ncbi:anaerobic ribonucleoside-triphosphate reductase activating protein [Maledivibacter halophilus]|uniref:Anaerobic ribonucleoside-triphosphate reductase-activating protein n=1 Tax=Maledivibacter halophilus TaxID=36842 RepID=A0A1T5JEZ2_9FIRM|nr:anaerobic ribonucleoside-triphosphate reductase activating protein [Maledivibacter halophilus]SKC49802.1 anaerobic ribonucleoside-triphosphate reductase activating protein [Maledivibacter halophilus]